MVTLAISVRMTLKRKQPDLFELSTKMGQDQTEFDPVRKSRVTDAGYYQLRPVASGQRSSAFDWGDRWSAGLQRYWRRMLLAIRA